MLKLFTFILVSAIVATTISQLLTPFMVCEMQQMKLRGVETGLTYDDPVAKEIRDYCMEHAYDNLFNHTGNLGTLG
ncbi:hypothetical protein ACF0H5_023571 [Mactra antiquata]